jgi:formylglycine-generating enzyme required for sulfatase activity
MKNIKSLRKVTPSVIALFLLLNWTAKGQTILHLKNACSFDRMQEETEIYADNASDEATQIIYKIMKINNLPPNFIIKSGNVENALASVEGKQRYILYSTNFLESFKQDEDAKWASYCVMAHEIGHHLSNHDMDEKDPSRCRLREIQADKFAGGILFRMGATLKQAQSGIEKYTQNAGSKTHPPKSARLEAVASGWKQMQETMREQGFEQPKPTETKHTEKVELTPPSVLFADKKKFDFEPEMVFVKGGSFEMGSNENGDNEKPVHTVALSDFHMGKYEVTQKQWSEVMGNNPSGWDNCGDDCPVEQVSWDDVQVFLKKLNEKTGKNYRLPTEAEWEYAARGGNKSKNYIFSGDNLIGNVAWYDGNSGNQTQKVGKRKANELGIFDMSGNVGEWCSDFYNAGYYKLSTNSNNPQGPISGENRVARGGVWIFPYYYCTVSYRDNNKPDFRNGGYGFRCVRDH